MTTRAARRILLGGALLLALLCPRPAPAHEVLHSVERGRAVGVKAFFPDGEVLAYVQYEVFSPADSKIPYQKGRTDRSGYLAFVPNVPGKWRVKLVDDTGHGLDTTVEVAPSEEGTISRSGDATTTLAFVLRPMIGIAAIVSLFGGLFLTYRRRGSKA